MKVGLQVYSVRNRFQKDPYGTLEEVAKAGYKYIEMANHNADIDEGTGFGVPVKKFKKKVDELGLQVVGAHILPSNPKQNLAAFFTDLEQIKRIIDYYAKLGASNLSVAIDFFKTKQDIIDRCEWYNKIGELCRESGIYFLYHNHYNEFQRINGEYIMDLILGNTDEKNLGIELDAYWMIRGLFDPAGMIRKFGKRIALLHEKDFPLSEANELNAWNVIDQDDPCDWDTFHSAVKPSHFTEIGYGIIKIQEVIDAGNEFGIPYILVEQDYSKYDEIESIKMSMGSFKKMRGIEWD